MRKHERAFLRTEGPPKRTFPGLSLWTFQKNTAARASYERHGFEAVDETDGAANEEREPDLLYTWIVQPRPL